MFGKSLELVYFLRKKDDVIYDKFVEILKQKRGSKDRLVDTMSKKRIEIGKIFYLFINLFIFGTFLFSKNSLLILKLLPSAKEIVEK